MKQKHVKLFTLIMAMAALMTLGACRPKPAPPPPTVPPPAPAPTASLSANPDTVQRGQATQLTWQSENATEVQIEGIGTVPPSGSQSVTPDSSTTYRLLARGPGGRQEATARVTVTEPPPPARTTAPPTATDEQLFAQNVRDVFFDYDSFAIRPDGQSALEQTAKFLQQHANISVVIEGHADERGSTEYNLSLGDNRARSAREALVQRGIDGRRIDVISFGKEKPFCTESNEQCWQQNRRAHFRMKR